MSSVATGCGKTTLTNTVQNENKQKDSDAWMEDDASGQKDTDKSETSKEEEYYDVDKIQGGEVDYSKYEEKKSSRAASGNSNSNVTYSDGTGSGQDQYQTNPVPEGMQNPVPVWNIFTLCLGFSPFPSRKYRKKGYSILSM